MAKTLAQRISAAIPHAGEVIVGTVTSGNPLVVSARGGPINGAGRLLGAGVNVGDPVALIRQDATWLVLGKTVSAAGSGLGITNIFMSACNLAISLTAVEQDVSGTSITFTTQAPSATILAVWFADFESLGANTTSGEVRLSVDGVTALAPVATTRATVATDRHTAGQMDMFTVNAGSHTLLLRTVRVSGTDGTLRINQNNTTLTVVVLQ